MNVQHKFEEEKETNELINNFNGESLPIDKVHFMYATQSTLNLMEYESKMDVLLVVVLNQVIGMYQKVLKCTKIVSQQTKLYLIKVMNQNQKRKTQML